MEIKGAYRQNLFSISFASSTSTILNFFSSFSFDQSGHLSFNASATYSVSLVCGNNALFASASLSLNSSEGITLIRFLSNANTVLNSSSGSFDFSKISALCDSNSENISSGATGSILSENSRSIVLPFDNMPEQMMFASTTMIIHFSPEYFFLYFSCIDFEILLPISIASFSVSVLFATIDLNKASPASLSRIASLATSDQFMNFDSSIFCFMSSGTDNVIFGIKFTSHITHNTHKYLKLANAVIASLKSKASSRARRTGSSLQQCGKILVFVNVGEGNVANAVEELKT